MMEITFHPLQPTKAYLCFLSVLPLIHVDPNKWKKVSAVPVSRRGKPPPTPGLPFVAVAYFHLQAQPAM